MERQISVLSPESNKHFKKQNQTNYFCHMNEEPHIDSKGTKRWRLNGVLHRVDGPAVEFEHGEKHWYLNGQIHRTDGPAVIWFNGESFYWYLHGERLSFSEWKTRRYPHSHVYINYLKGIPVSTIKPIFFIL